MNDSTLAELQLARLKVLAELDYLPAVDGFVRRMAKIEGLDERAVDRLALVMEEAVTNVIEHAYLPGERGEVELALSRRPGQLVVAVEDQGIPFDAARFLPDEDGEEAENELGSGLGMTLMRAFADELRVVNLGKRGKRVELVKDLPLRDVEAFLSEAERLATPLQEREVARVDTPVSLRRMRADEAVSLSRLVYRVYGYSYAGDFIYHPERVRERLASRVTLSWVAVTPDDEIVGHVALNLEFPQAPVGEIAQVVVDPRFRGRRLFERMQGELLAFAAGRGMYGAYSEAVTVHPYTQKGNLALGAHEIGFMFGYSPSKTRFKGIEEHQVQRQTALLMYSAINPAPRRVLYPPFHHEGMVRRLVEINALDRELVGASLSGTLSSRLPSHSTLEVRARPEWGHAVITVLQPGEDLLALVRMHLRELCLNGSEAIFLDLPLEDPNSAAQCAAMESLGFSFSGLVPELGSTGDVLRLQYLNNVTIDPTRLKVASPFGRELLEYVAAQMTQGLAA